MTGLIPREEGNVNDMDYHRPESRLCLHLQDYFVQVS
jgi:hypothetical protein